MINLCFSGSAEGTLRFFYKNFEIESKSICCAELALHGGDISIPFDIEKRRSYLDIPYYKNYTNRIKRDISKFNRKLKKCDALYIWFCRTNIDEHLGMMWAVNYAKDIVGDIYLCDCTEYGDGLGLMQNYNPNYHFSVKKHKLSRCDTEKISDEWLKLCNENSGLRILENKKPVSKPIDYFDEQIFGLAGKETIKVTKILQPMLCREESRFMFAFILNRIDYLIKTNKFILVKEGYIDKRLKALYKSDIRKNEDKFDLSK